MRTAKTLFALAVTALCVLFTSSAALAQTQGDDRKSVTLETVELGGVPMLFGDQVSGGPDAHLTGAGIGAGGSNNRVAAKFALPGGEALSELAFVPGKLQLATGSELSLHAGQNSSKTLARLVFGEYDDLRIVLIDPLVSVRTVWGQELSRGDTVPLNTQLVLTLRFPDAYRGVPTVEIRTGGGIQQPLVTFNWMRTVRVSQ